MAEPGGKKIRAAPLCVLLRGSPTSSVCLAAGDGLQLLVSLRFLAPDVFFLATAMFWPRVKNSLIKHMYGVVFYFFQDGALLSQSFFFSLHIP